MFRLFQFFSDSKYNRLDMITPADVVIALDTGPEVIAGSTRLKAGTATKITLNAMSTTAFVLLGKTYGGLMVDVRRHWRGMVVSPPPSPISGTHFERRLES